MAITISLPRSSGRTASWCATRRSATWSDGFDKLGDASYDGFVTRITKEKSGWINIPIGPGSSYVPERGESGPWCWAPSGAADGRLWRRAAGQESHLHLCRVAGREALGLEATGAVWSRNSRKRRRCRRWAMWSGRSPWAEQMNLQVRTFERGTDGARRRSGADRQGRLHHARRFVGTRRPALFGADVGTRPIWNRWAAKTPLPMPTPITTLFTAVIGPDGQFVKAQDVVHWSGSFTATGRPRLHRDFVMRQTDAAPRAANIPLGPDQQLCPGAG
ncbi:MAG: hypothetical protein R2838_12490 [Caldilineaceae bacterium]